MQLLEFPHSHYCEKARWALDFKQIPYRRVALLPGFHLQTVRRHAPRTSVPVLLTDTAAVQGSSEIIDYLDQHYPESQLTPREPDNQLLCAELEQKLDKKLGGPIRTILYDRLLVYPDFIRYCFTHTLSLPKQVIFRLYYPFLRRLMHHVYVQSDQKVAAAKEMFSDALYEMEARIGADRYLFEGRFTRADLSVCSMLSLLILPPQFPMTWPEIPDPAIQALQDYCRNHPVGLWVRLMYELHRQPIVT